MQSKSDQPSTGGDHIEIVKPSGRSRLPDVALPPVARKTLSPQEAAKMVERLRGLCVTQGDDVTALEEATKSLRESGYKQELSQLFREAIWWPETHPHVGALWMRRLLSSNNWDRRYPKTMDELCEKGEIGRRAVIEFLQTVPSKNRKGLVRQAVRRHGRWLSKDPRGWEVAARALVAGRLYSSARRWMRNCDQSQLDLPLLHCLALALRGDGREKQAQEVIALALTRFVADQQFSVFHLWQAQEEALAGNTSEASAQFKQVHPEGWEDDALVLYYLVRGVIRVQRAESGSRSQAFWQAYDRVGEQLGRRRIYKCDAMLRRQYRRCLWRMARDSGNVVRGLVACWRSADSWVLIAPLLIVPGLQLLLPLYLLRLCTNRRGQFKRA